jgi:two-component system phosphate regulon sensor histidine kinase PhoR
MPLGRLTPLLILLAAVMAVIAGILSGLYLFAVAGVTAAATVALLELLSLQPTRRDHRLMRNRVHKIGDGAAAIGDALPIRTEDAFDLWRDFGQLLRLEAARVAALKAETARAKAVLTYLPDPVLLVDRARRVLETNSAAEELLGENLVGRDLGAAIRIPAVLSATESVLAGNGPRVVEFDLNVPVERSLRARIELMAGDQPAALLAITDFTMVKRAEQLRADFVANASHELRTPLSTVVGFIETLEGPAANDEAARRRFLPIMRQQAARMARLVDDLLSLSRIELNEHLPPRGRVDLPKVLQTVIQALDLKASARNMRFVLGCDESTPNVLGDPEELSQVFQNLLDNAIKYASRGSVVEITVKGSRKLRQGVSIAIRDQGEGIPRAHLPRLTERFYRVDTARSREMGGTGLGLAIVKHIINRHRGALEIESEVGVGSTFTVHLQTAPGARMADPNPQQAPEPVDIAL